MDASASVRLRARHDVAKALYHRRLVRPATCEQCPAEKNLEAHHDDYSKTLDVRWLCKKCHGAHHRALKAAA